MDKTLKGFSAGILAGIGKNLLDFISYHIIDFTEMRYLEHAFKIFLERMPQNTPEIIFAFLIDLWFTGFLGLIFVYLLTALTSKNYLFKGWLYGSGLWFFIHVIGVVFQVPSFEEMALTSLVSHLFTDSSYGLLLAFILVRLDKR